jgi:subtilisin
MASKETQYIIVPASGLVVADSDPQQGQFFESLSQTFSSKSQMHSFTTESGLRQVKVLDSIGEKKAKLIECLPDDLPALRASHPSVRILPVVYYQPAVVHYRVAVQVKSLRAKSLKAVSAKAMMKGAKGVASNASAMLSVSSPTITITVVSSTDGKPVANAMVSAFTDFASKTGAGGTTNSNGQVALALGSASKKIERLYVYPPSASWRFSRRTSLSRPV